jgi:hypothetical protein
VIISSPNSTRGAVIALLSCVLLLPAGRAAALPADVPLVLWVWEHPSPRLIDTVVADGFDVVFLHVQPGSTSDPAIQRFIESAHQASVDVYALAGVPRWAHVSGPFFAWMDEVLQSERFDGIVIDIEPHLLADWASPKRRVGLVDDYLSLLETARLRAGTLPLVTTVPFWWDDSRYQVRRESLLVEDVLMRSDAIAVMAYRDQLLTGDGILAVTANEVRLAAAHGKQVYVTLQTARDSLPKLTFFEEGKGALDAAVETLADAWNVGRGFGGVAIHSYRSYVALEP